MPWSVERLGASQPPPYEPQRDCDCTWSKTKTRLQQQPQPFSSWSPCITNTHTDTHQILLFATTCARNQPADLIRDISASSIYKLCTVATHISSPFFFFPEYSTQGHDYLSTCVMETFPPWLGIPPCFHYNTAIHLPPHPYLDGVRGVRRASGGA